MDAPTPTPAAAPPAYAPTGHPTIAKEERDMAMWTNLSALSGFVLSGVGFVLGPLVFWLVKKDQMPFVDRHGKAMLNFQLTMFLALIVSIVLILVLVGLFLVVAVAVVDIVFVITNTVGASKGEEPKYPFAIRFIK